MSSQIFNHYFYIYGALIENTTLSNMIKYIICSDLHHINQRSVIVIQLKGTIINIQV